MQGSVRGLDGLRGHVIRSRALLRGLRAARRRPVTEAEARDRVARDANARQANFLSTLDELVWSWSGSPYLELLTHAGVERGDLRDLVARAGVERALETLRDEGVFISYAEWLGRQPVVRGSKTLQLRPDSFFNPRFPPDLLGSTGGTRSGGTSVSLSFANIRHGAVLECARMATWGTRPGPTALWLPVLPAGAGLNALIRNTAVGRTPERWFSQIDPSTHDIRAVLRVANRLLPVLSRASGVRVPRAEFAPAGDARLVLAWCRDALARAGAAMITGYASSIVNLARAATREGVSLEGLSTVLTGEPVTASKFAAVSASGATVVNRYAFMQFGSAGDSCPHCHGEEVHLWDTDAAVVTRTVTRADGIAVPALLWTSLQGTARSVLLNVENDDYATVIRDRVCPCLLGQLGCRTMLRGVRGISKVVAAGVTVRGDHFETLVDRVLPDTFGGGPGDYQFVEVEDAGSTYITLRVHPIVGVLDEGRVRDTVGALLRHDDPGALADGVWRGGDVLRIERAAPRPARSGKVLAFEGLASANDR